MFCSVSRISRVSLSRSRDISAVCMCSNMRHPSSEFLNCVVMSRRLPSVRAAEVMIMIVMSTAIVILKKKILVFMCLS